MHRMSDIAKVANIYSGSSYEEKQASLKFLTRETQQTIRNLNITGREAMERTNTSKMLAATTKDLREIAREAHRRGLNRRLKPAQFKLLDPKGTHILSLQFFHDRADRKLVEMHVRASAHIKLIGKAKAVELFLDVPMEFVADYLTGQEKLELMDRALQQGSVERTVDDDGNVLEPPEREVEMVNMSDIAEPTEATPNAERAEGNA
jgi:hypothetical protein